MHFGCCCRFVVLVWFWGGRSHGQYISLVQDIVHHRLTAKLDTLETYIDIKMVSIKMEILMDVIPNA